MAFIIYDPKCSVCLRVKRLLELVDRDRVLSFISLYDSERLKQFPELDLDDCHGRVHLVSSDRQVFQGALAVEEILRLLSPKKALPWLERVLELAFVKSCIANGYDYLNAYRLKKRGACEVCR